MLFRAKLFDGVRFSDEIVYSEDLLFNFVISQKAEKISFVNEEKYNYFHKYLSGYCFSKSIRFLNLSISPLISSYL